MTPMLFALYGVVVLALVVLGAGIGALILIGYYAVVEVCIHREHNRRPMNLLALLVAVAAVAWCAIRQAGSR